MNLRLSKESLSTIKTIVSNIVGTKPNFIMTQRDPCTATIMIHGINFDEAELAITSFPELVTIIKTFFGTRS